MPLHIAICNIRHPIGAATDFVKSANLAPTPWIEQGTYWLTASCSTAELSRKILHAAGANIFSDPAWMHL